MQAFATVAHLRPSIFSLINCKHVRVLTLLDAVLLFHFGEAVVCWIIVSNCYKQKFTDLFFYSIL